MNKKSLLAIENIITYITELDIITKGRDDNYFYDSYEMPILCDLVYKIEINLNKISSKIKKKYNNVNWNIIDSLKENDNDYMILKLGKTWKLSNGILKKELYHKLRNILEIELPTYYTKYCNQQHEKTIKNKRDD